MADQNIDLKRVTAALSVVLICTFAMGRCSAGDRGSDAPVKAERVPVPGPTRTVTKTEIRTEAVTKIQVPESCIRAIDGLEDISTAASELADVGTPQLDIMRDAHQAMAGNQHAKLVDLQEDQMDLNDKTVKFVADLELSILPILKKYSKQCRTRSN